MLLHRFYGSPVSVDDVSGILVLRVGVHVKDALTIERFAGDQEPPMAHRFQKAILIIAENVQSLRRWKSVVALRRKPEPDFGVQIQQRMIDPAQRTPGA